MELVRLKSHGNASMGGEDLACIAATFEDSTQKSRSDINFLQMISVHTVSTAIDRGKDRVRGSITPPPWCVHAFFVWLLLQTNAAEQMCEMPVANEICN